MNIWGYIALICIGIIIGTILEWYIVRDRIMNKTVEIRKNKQKNGAGNVQDIELEMNEAETGKPGRIAEREARQEERKVKREARKAKRNINNSLNK